MSDVLNLFGELTRVDSQDEEVTTQLKKKRKDLFRDFLPDITKNKTNIIKSDPSCEKDLSVWMLNHSLSMWSDTAMYANEMNKLPHLPKHMVYDFYIAGIPAGYRKNAWKKKSNVDDIELVQEAFYYNEKRAIEALELLSDGDIAKLRQNAATGGRT